MNKAYGVAPVIRILCLLVFSISVIYGKIIDLFFAFFLLMLLHFYRPTTSLRTMWVNLRQIRWLLLTIILLYSWATPGQILFPEYAAYSPSREGLLLGIGRCFSLIFMFVAVYWVLNSLSRSELLAALLVLLGVLPLSSERKDRIAVRVMLSLELVPQIKRHVSDAMQRLPQTNNRHWYQVSWLAGIFEQLLFDMEAREPIWLEMPGQQSIPLIQWSYPFFLATVFWLVGVYFG